MFLLDSLLSPFLLPLLLSTVSLNGRTQASWPKLESFRKDLEWELSRRWWTERLAGFAAMQIILELYFFHLEQCTDYMSSFFFILLYYFVSRLECIYITRRIFGVVLSRSQSMQWTAILVTWWRVAVILFKEIYTKNMCIIWMDVKGVQASHRTNVQ